jgi:uncharacterized protein
MHRRHGPQAMGSSGSDKKPGQTANLQFGPDAFPWRSVLGLCRSSASGLPNVPISLGLFIGTQAGRPRSIAGSVCFGREQSDVLSRLLSWPQRLLIVLVKGYRLLLSPSLGSSCRFEPSCSLYAIASLQQHGALGGSYLTLRRLVRCHPWCDGGHDPVPPRLFGSLIQGPISSSDKKSS